MSVYKPTDQDRRMVEAMAAAGIPQDEISRCVGVAAKTLRKHYRAELDTGATRANVAVCERLHKAALSGNVTAMIFWLKCRAGWKPTSVHEVVGPDGGPLQTKTQLDPSKLDPGEAQTLLDLLEKATP